MGDQGIEALSIGLKESKSLATLDLHNNFGNPEYKFGPKGAAALASAIAVMGSLTKLDLLYNQLDESAKAALRAAARPALKLDL